MAGNDDTLRLKILADIDKAKRDLASLQKQADELEDPIKVKADTSSIGAFAQSVRTNMAGAEGAIGKVRAAGSTMLDGLTQMGPAALVGAAGAIGAFAVKAVGHFVDVSKAALDMGDTIGTSTEDASRWIAVADDFGVGAEQLEGALGKVAKTLDADKWAAYGIATHDAAGQARDANDIILDALDTLSKIPNETERARVGNELFGKGFANLAPILGHTREEYEKMLGAVEDGQVITEEEAENAERMRKAQDALADAIDNLTLSFGGMVAEAAPAVQAFADLILKAQELEEALPEPDDGGAKGFFGTIIESGKRALSPIHAVTGALGDLQDKGSDTEVDVKGVAVQIDSLTGGAVKNALAMADAADATDSFNAALLAPLQTVADLAAAYDEANTAQAAFFDAQRAAADSSYAVAQAGDDLVETILGYSDAVAAAEGDTAKLRDVQDQTRESATKYADAQVKLAEDTAKADGATLSAKDSQKLWLSSMLEAAAFMEGPQKQAVLDYIARVEGIPPEKLTEILADPDNQSIDAATAAIDEAAKDRDSTIAVDVDASEAARKIASLRAQITAPISWLIGAPRTTTASSAPADAGPSVGTTAAPTLVRSGGGTITNNITLNTRATSGRELTRELNRWARLNGRSRG